MASAPLLLSGPEDRLANSNCAILARLHVITTPQHPLGSARASRAGDGALAIANFRFLRALRRGAAMGTRGACAPQILSPRYVFSAHDDENDSARDVRYNHNKTI